MTAHHIRNRMLIAAIVLVVATGQAVAAGPSPEYMALPAEISLMKNGAEYTFQNELGNPFYAFDDDEKTKSHCVDACAKIWAPVLARKDAKALGDWTLVARGTGQRQWAYNGHPVYTNVAENAGGSPPDLAKETHWHKLVP